MTYYPKVNTEIRNQLFVDLISKNHPDFAAGTNLHSAITQNPGYFKMEHILETMMPLCSNGQYEFNDGIHEDYTDGSDSKAGTLYMYEASNSYFAEITSVRSKHGVLKNGAIRAVILNPYEKKFHFVFIPKAAVYAMMTNKKTGNPLKLNSLKLRFDKKAGKFTAPVDKYGCVEYNTFKELAMAMEENH